MDRSKSIEELEGTAWPAPEFQSYVVVESHRLRKVPLQSLSVDDLRLLVGQKIGLEYTVLIAIEHLEVNPMAAGAMYRGDLLANVIGLPTGFWESHRELNNRLVEIRTELEVLADTAASELLPSMHKFDFR